MRSSGLTVTENGFEPKSVIKVVIAVRCGRLTEAGLINVRVL